MQILFILNARIPTEKAYGIQVAKNIEAFKLSGQEVELLGPDINDEIQQDIFSFYNLKIKFPIIYKKNYFSFLSVINDKIYFKFQRPLFVIQSVLYALVKKYDLIYCRDVNIAFILSLFNKKVVFENHEPKTSRLWMYKIVLRKIKQHILVAYNLKDLYKKFDINKSKYVVAPNGVDLESSKKIQADKNIWQKEFGFTQDEKVILYVGHFYEWKGVYTLIEAAKYLKQGKIVLIGGTKFDQKKVKEYIFKKYYQDKQGSQANAGNQSALPRLPDEILACSDNLNICLHDFVPHQQAIQYLKSADILILPNTAKEERSSKYTTPIKLFEYMASGVPIIASRLKSFASYLRDRENCLFFKADNAKDLAEKINYLLNQPELAKKLAKNSLAQVKEYTWQKRVEKILEFIKKQ